MRETLSFTRWNLFHASTLSESLQPGREEETHLRTIGSLLSHLNLFAQTEELRLRNGLATHYADYRRTGLAGHLAEGMALLFMQSRGYTYVERMEALVARNPGLGGPRAISLRTRNGNPDREADFIFENAAGFALTESKGSFVTPGSSPGIKGDLRAGLGQIEGWDTYIDPPPVKSFVIGTYFREENDGHAESPLVAFVDPEGDEHLSENAIRLFRDDVRRANYAATMRQMGFNSAALALTREERREDIVPRPLFEMPLPEGDHSRRLAFRIIAAIGEPAFPPDELAGVPLKMRFHFPWIWGPFTQFLISGMETNALQAVEAAVSESESRALMELRPLTDIGEIGSPDNREAIAGSLFPDGSFLGAISAKWFVEQRLKTKEFKL